MSRNFFSIRLNNCILNFNFRKRVNNNIGYFPYVLDMYVFMKKHEVTKVVDFKKPAIFLTHNALGSYQHDCGIGDALIYSNWQPH